MIEKLVVQPGRLGTKAGKGFYDYPADGKKHLWSGLAELAPPPDGAAVRGRTEDALPLIQALERRAARGRRADRAREADVGAILGWGFAPWSGGPLSLIDTVGLKAFVAECDRMAQAYGPRFAPNALLRQMAEKGETFYGAADAKKAASTVGPFLSSGICCRDPAIHERRSKLIDGSRARPGMTLTLSACPVSGAGRFR